MSMYNPPHPGEFILAVYLEPYGIDHQTVSELLKVSASTFNKLIKKQTNVTPEMALRLSKTLGRTAESWLIMQDNYNLWQTRQSVNLDNVERLVLPK
jgi:addiction module HigA family antidote